MGLSKKSPPQKLSRVETFDICDQIFTPFCENLVFFLENRFRRGKQILLNSVLKLWVGPKIWAWWRGLFDRLGYRQSEPLVSGETVLRGQLCFVRSLDNCASRKYLPIR